MRGHIASDMSSFILAAIAVFIHFRQIVMVGLFFIILTAMVKRYFPIILSLTGAALLWAAWPTSPLTFLIFIAFIPLLRLADTIENKGRFFACAFLLLFFWNVATTWWVGNTTVPASGVAANLLNTLFMLAPLMGYRRTRKWVNPTLAWFTFVVYWMTFEYIHLQWEFSWPWLSLGNAFAMHPNWVQWYEYTGVSGGTLWILATNIAIYHTWFQHKYYQRPLAKLVWTPALILLIPFLISYSHVLFPSGLHKGRIPEVVIVQPNIDPYDKFADENESLEIDKMIGLTRQKIDSNTDYIIWPETALFVHGVWENQVTYEAYTQRIRQLLQQYPRASLVSGAVTLKRYNNQQEESASARHNKEENLAYDVFNAGLLIDTSKVVQVYHKSKLVPGVELIPYVRYLKFMDHLALDMGGISGSYGRTPGVAVMENPTTHLKVFPTICYESVYSEFVAEHVRKGANFLFIMTNDGWWGDTEGHRQHLQYARLRAIETRRWVARSANTGISAIIDDQGNIRQSLPYWEEGVLKGQMIPNDLMTFYVKYGDLLSKAAVIFSILLIIYSFFLRFTRKRISKL
jgi:apolipoprotein N-acyltransferase